MSFLGRFLLGAVGGHSGWEMTLLRTFSSGGLCPGWGWKRIFWMVFSGKIGLKG